MQKREEGRLLRPKGVERSLHAWTPERPLSIAKGVASNLRRERGNGDEMRKGVGDEEELAADARFS